MKYDLSPGEMKELEELPVMVTRASDWPRRPRGLDYVMKPASFAARCILLALFRHAFARQRRMPPNMAVFITVEPIADTAVHATRSSSRTPTTPTRTAMPTSPAAQARHAPTYTHGTI